MFSWDRIIKALGVPNYAIKLRNLRQIFFLFCLKNEISHLNISSWISDIFSKQISTFLKRHFWYGNSFLPQSIFQTFFPMKDRSNNILTIESSFCRKWMQKMLNLFLQRLDSFNQVVYVKWLKCQTWTHLAGWWNDFLFQI